MQKIINNFEEIKLFLNNLNIQNKYYLFKNKKNYGNFDYSSIIETALFLKENNHKYIKSNSVKANKKYIKDFISSSKTYMYFSDKTENLFNFSDYQFKNIITDANDKELFDLLNIMFRYQEIDKIKITLNIINDRNIILTEQYIESLTHLFFTPKIEWLTGRLQFNEKNISTEEAAFFQGILTFPELSKVKECLMTYLNYSENKIIEKISSSLQKRDIFIELNNKDSTHLKRIEYFKEYVASLKSIIEAMELKDIIVNNSLCKHTTNKKRL